MLHVIHTVLVVGAALILTLFGSVLLAPLAQGLRPTLDPAERRDPCACIEPD